MVRYVLSCSPSGQVLGQWQARELQEAAVADEMVNSSRLSMGQSVSRLVGQAVMANAGCSSAGFPIHSPSYPPPPRPSYPLTLLSLPPPPAPPIHSPTRPPIEARSCRPMALYTAQQQLPIHAAIMPPHPPRHSHPPVCRMPPTPT